MWSVPENASFGLLSNLLPKELFSFCNLFIKGKRSVFLLTVLGGFFVCAKVNPRLYFGLLAFILDNQVVRDLTGETPSFIDRVVFGVD